MGASSLAGIQAELAPMGRSYVGGCGMASYGSFDK